jgi:hypothetical protein
VLLRLSIGVVFALKTQAKFPTAKVVAAVSGGGMAKA